MTDFLLVQTSLMVSTNWPLFLSGHISMTYEEITYKSLVVQPTEVLTQRSHTMETTANQRRFYVVTPNQHRFTVVSTLGARYVNIRKVTGEEREDGRKKRNRV